MLVFRSVLLFRYHNVEFYYWIDSGFLVLGTLLLAFQIWQVIEFFEWGGDGGW